MSKHRELAEHYFQQGRYAEAEDQYRAALGHDPNDPVVRTMLSLCLASQDDKRKKKEALEEAQAAVHQAPDFSFAHYALGVALIRLDQNRKALKALQEALRLDPESADYLAAISEVCYIERRYQEALDYAEQGLQIEGEHVVCNNLRASALIKLGRKTQASENLASILARDPENADTHANMGYAALERGDYKQSFEHFREALRLDPEHDYAREGIIMAMKARNPLYRPLLRYFLWMDKFSKGGSFLIIIGLVIAINVLNRILGDSPITYIIVGAYLIFAMLTWMGESLFNLILRLDKFGRYCLTPIQIMASNFVGGLLLISLLCVGGVFFSSFYLGTDRYMLALLVAALCSFALTVPTAGTFNAWAREGTGRYILLACTMALLALAVLGIQESLAINMFSQYVIWFIYGWAGYTWIANLVQMR